MGRLLITSIANRDFPVVQSVVLIFAAGFVIVNMLVDLFLYGDRPADEAAMSIDTTGAPLPSPLASDSGDVVVRRGGWLRAICEVATVALD